ncbi:glutathione S-transferase 1 [Papilio machaon]|uniref:glutathione S-transferase 1 n=1 Tax=Papilio machaon TaxID=76193 RepID=UPI001E663A67|nr:glutathione S-transferase 1 [Papilio machaon]XP_045538122.1 glutathione S-transferase 1 [Papilio machaon]XP_045538123.1 glutathione S-transferase 1 [Papilio machaon]
MVLKLYKSDASPPVRAVLMTIEAANIPNVEMIDVNVLEGDHLKEEYLKMNPQHTIPTLQDDDFYIWDSHAIAVYLLTKYSNNTTLYPSDPKQRAIINQRLHFDSGILFPNLRAVIEPLFYKGEKSFKQESLDKIKSGYEFSEKFLTKRWIAGDEFTLADIFFLASIRSSIEVQPIDSEEFPKLTDWLNRCKELDCHKKVNEPGSIIFRNSIRRLLG